MQETHTARLMNDAKFREMWADKAVTVDRIAEIYGCSPWTINKARNLLGLPKRTSGVHRPAGKLGPAKRAFVKSPPVKMRAPEVAPPPEVAPRWRILISRWKGAPRLWRRAAFTTRSASWRRGGACRKSG